MQLVQDPRRGRVELVVTAPSFLPLPTGGGELPTPAIWCGMSACSAGLRQAAPREAISARSGIHLRSREQVGWGTPVFAG